MPFEHLAPAADLQRACMSAHPAKAPEPLTSYPTQVHIKDVPHKIEHLSQAAWFFTLELIKLKYSKK